MITWMTMGTHPTMTGKKERERAGKEVFGRQEKSREPIHTGQETVLLRGSHAARSPEEKEAAPVTCRKRSQFRGEANVLPRGLPAPSPLFLPLVLHLVLRATEARLFQ